MSDQELDPALRILAFIAAQNIGVDAIHFENFGILSERKPRINIAIIRRTEDDIRAC